MPVISASDIGTYLYCRRAWWYKKHGVESANQTELAVGTHLHARYESSVAHQYRAHRAGQIVQIAAAARSVRSALVVGGDFNLEESHEEYAVLLGLTGLRDAAAEAGRREATLTRDNPYRFQSAKPDRRIDLLLTRSGVDTGVRVRHAERVFDEPFDHSGRRLACSNHAGVLAEHELEPGAGAPLAAPDQPNHVSCRLARHQRPER